MFHFCKRSMEAAGCRPRTDPPLSAESYLALQRRHTQTHQQIPESPTVILTWHASKHKALNST